MFRVIFKKAFETGSNNQGVLKCNTLKNKAKEIVVSEVYLSIILCKVYFVAFSKPL